MRAMPTDGQNLCLSCGLCCDGTLYTHVPVGAAEPAEAFRAVGIRITQDRGGEGHYKLPQPCLRFENGRCRTYDCRSLPADQEPLWKSRSSRALTMGENRGAAR